MLNAQRQAVIDQASWVVNHASGFHYAQTRPVNIAAFKSGRTPIYTDCSGSIIGIAARAGVPDPSGYRFTGYGNTDSFRSRCEHLPDYQHCLPGDIIDVTSHGDAGTVHAYLVVEKTAAGDFRVFSFGANPPKFEMLSQVHGYWYGRGYYFLGLRWLSTETRPRYRWHIVSGGGHVIGKTNHPKIWVAAHPTKIFRTYNRVQFIDQLD